MTTNQELFLQYFTKYGQYYTAAFNQMTENAQETMLLAAMLTMESGESTMSEASQNEIMVKYLLGSTQSKLLNALKKIR